MKKFLALTVAVIGLTAFAQASTPVIHQNDNHVVTVATVDGALSPLVIELVYTPFEMAKLTENQLRGDGKALTPEELAEAQKAAEQQEANRQAEAKRQADEAEAKRLADEAEAKRQADEAESKRLADEAELKRLTDEAEAKRQADEAETNRILEEQQSEAEKQLNEKAEANLQAAITYLEQNPDVSEIYFLPDGTFFKGDALGRNSASNHLKDLRLQYPSIDGTVDTYKINRENTIKPHKK